MGRNQDYSIISGHIESKGTLYYHMVISDGFLPSGRRNRISVSTGLPLKGNSRKANAMLNETIHSLEEARRITDEKSLKVLHEIIKEHGLKNLHTIKDTQEDCSPDNPLFSDIVEQWLKYISTSVSENTAIKYEYCAKHIISYFAQKQVRIKDLSSIHIADYYVAKRKGNPENGIKVLAARTLKDHKTVLDGAINYALKIMKVIKVNPSADVTAPRSEVKSPTYFTESQLNDVISKIQGNTIESAVVITSNFGLRRQEVLGLKWSAVDFEKKTITVRHTVTQVGNKDVCADRTKTTSSLRTLPLMAQMLAYFRKLKAFQDAMKSMYGRSYQSNDYICKWPDGHRLRPNYVTETWANFLEDNDFKHITFHDLRHSAASMLLQMGFSLIEIQQWLGHADIKSTARYVHVGFADKQKIADKINLALLIPGVEAYLDYPLDGMNTEGIDRISS